VGLASSLALVLGETSTVRRRNTSSVGSTSVKILLAHLLAVGLVCTVSRGSLVAHPCGTVANVRRGEARLLALGQRHTFSWCSGGNTCVGTFRANVTVTGFVLVVHRASPFLETGRWVVRIRRLTSAVRSRRAVFVYYRHRTPTA